MAFTRTTLAEVRVHEGKVDRAKLDATTEEDIQRYMREDGETNDLSEAELRPSFPAAYVRKQWGMGQARFAKVIGVPVGTVRNWEQGRVFPDAAARTLLTVMAREPEAVLRALQVARPEEPTVTPTVEPGVSGARQRRAIGSR